MNENILLRGRLSPTPLGTALFCSGDITPFPETKNPFTRSSFGDALVSSLSVFLCLKTREDGVDVVERLSIYLDI